MNELEDGQLERSRPAEALDQRFVDDLDTRMAKSKLEESGWRGRDDLDDIMHDLERLAARDWVKAAKLWEKYRPEETDRPKFIDNDDRDPPLKSAGKNGQTKNPEVDAANFAQARRDEADLNSQFDVPESLKKRFRHAEGKYYYRDNDDVPAFEDKGRRLTTPHDDPTIARSMVDLAEAKGWASLKLRGSEAFKREVWLHASLKGLAVEGFSPREVDHVRLKELQDELSKPHIKAREINHQTVRTPRADPTHNSPLSDQQLLAIEGLKTLMRGRGDSEKAIAMAAGFVADRLRPNRVYVGKVIDHGAAPYQNDPTNSQSPYVKLDTEAGERTVWGIDLPRAMAEANAAVGDTVTLSFQGKQRPETQPNDRGEKNASEGTHDIVAKRNIWEIQKLEVIRESGHRQQNINGPVAYFQPVVPVFDRTAPAPNREPIPERERQKESERSRT